MQQRIAVGVAAIPACLGLVLTSGPTQATTVGARTHSTSFALEADGFGTHLNGAQVPAGSSTTGSQAIGCTTRAGLNRTNDVASAPLPGVGSVQTVRTRDWTTDSHGVVAAHATHSVGRVVLAQSSLGSLALTAIGSTATAYHDAKGFHATTSTKLGSLTFTPPVGPAQTFPLPTPDQPVTIPGLATIRSGRHVATHSRSGALADSYALQVTLIPSGTVVQVGHARATISSGVRSASFGGSSSAVRVVTALGGVIRTGSNLLNGMPCVGTHGTDKDKSAASIDLGGQVVTGAASTREYGVQTTRGATGVSQGKIARVSLGGGQVVANDIVGRATATRTAQGVRTAISGTTVGSVLVNGRRQTFPKSGVIEVPGLLKLQRSVVERSRDRISVVALRVTLLDGTGAVINLGEAHISLHPVG